jgi:hypothetical protein
MEPAMASFDRWRVEHAGLYTFPSSVKHVTLYQKFGFWPGALTAVMVRTAGAEVGSALPKTFSALGSLDQEKFLDACGNLTEAVFPGLRLDREVLAVRDQQLGDTILIETAGRLVAFGVCHLGPDTEAGIDTCYVKFGASRPGIDAVGSFSRLLDGVGALARSAGVSRVVAGISTARHDAYRRMLDLGFRVESQGIRMHRPYAPRYSREHDFVIDDWR